MHRDFARRIMALVLSVCMIAGMIDLSGFIVHAADNNRLIRDAEISVNGAPFIYDGQEKRPTVTVTDPATNTVIADSSYSLSYANNTNRGTATVTVTNNANAQDKVDVSFVIAAKNLSPDFSIAPIGQQILKGSTPVTPVITVKNAGNQELKGVLSPSKVGDEDYTYWFTGNDTVGTATVTVTGQNNYQGTLTATFEIIQLNAGKLSFKLDGDTIQYRNGEDRKIALRDVKYDTTSLTEGQDYSIRYNNINRATTKAEVQIIGMNDYAGLQSAIQYYTVWKSIEDRYDAGKNIVAESIADQSYAGPGVAVEFGADQIKLKDPDYPGEYLKPKTSDADTDYDYEIDTSAGTSGFENNTQETEQATVTVRGNGRYRGSLTLPFKIVAPKLEDSMVQVDDSACVYDGTDQFSKLKITVTKGTIEYVQGRDFTVDVMTAVHASKYQVVVRPAGTLKGDIVRKTFEVHPRDLSAANIALADNAQASYTYNGTAFTPGVKLTYTKADGSTQELVAGTDYVLPLNYANNINAGTAEVYAVGKGDFTGNSQKQTFEISPVQMTESNTTVTMRPDGQTPYTGEAIKPVVTVLVSGTRLTEDKDFTVECSNNLNVGTATVTITGKGNYTTGSSPIVKNFEIVQRDMKDVTVKVDSPIQFTGNPIYPEPVLTYNGKTLAKGVDYEVSNDDYSNNIYVGQASVKVRGIGNFTGEKSTNFTISKRDISSGTLTVQDRKMGYDFTNGDPADARYYEYTGQEVKPQLEITFNADGMVNVPLEEGADKDYTLVFSKNKEIGTAQIRIVPTMTGNYTGSKTLEFTIKGNLSDYGKDGFTEVEIPEQIYTSKEIVPQDTKVTFAGKQLVLGKDFEIECTDNITASDRAQAVIKGIGQYFDQTVPILFTIRPLDLEKDDLTKNNYVLGNVNDTYVYSGLQIRPQPNITHNGTALTYDQEYYVEYGIDGNEENINVGMGGLTIFGIAPNYENQYKKEFEIQPYDISASYAQGHIELRNVEKQVSWEEALVGTAAGVELTKDSGGVVQTNLEVWYTPVDLDGNDQTPRQLDSTEYDVTYENNNTIGTATIKVTGKGNFTGTVTEDFKIVGDLSGDKAVMTVEDWTYTPPKNGVITNTPEPVVIYNVEYPTGRIEEVTLKKDEDYTVSWSDNENATLNDTAAKVKITAVYEEDGSTLKGSYTGEQEKGFQILQRDLSKLEEDPLLSMTGLLEDGYEYTGLPIVPQLQISCDGTDLTWILSGEGSSEDYDYEISAVNNTNVYEYAQGPDGEKGERLTPIVTISARKSGEDYTGNYKGEFQKEFKINPREISQETIDTIVEVAGVTPEMDYTGEKVEFPLPSDPSKNAIDVTWSKNYDDGTQVRKLLVEDQDYEIVYKDNIKIGEATVTISAIEESNYAGSYDKHFKIMATIEVVDDPNPPIPYMELEYDHDVPFGIVDVYPKLIFKDYSGMLCGETNEAKILVEGEDFEIVTLENQGDAPEVSKNNKNVASEDAEEADRPTVVVRGIDCYRGIIKRFYNIIPKDLATDEGDITAEFLGSQTIGEYENAYIYNGSAIEPQVTVKNHGQTMMPNVDYKVVGYVNNTEISTEGKQAGVIIEAVEGSNYVNRKTLYFNIVPRSVEQMTINITDGAQIFDRKEKKPEIEVSFMDNGNQVILERDVDYEVSYENNIVAASASAGETAPVIIVTGIGKYGGTIRKTFTIEPESLSEENDDFDITAANATYTGQEVTTVIEVKAKDGTLLVEGEDYQLGAYSDNINAGTGYVAIQGIGNYTGTRQVPFFILPINIEGAFQIADIPEQQYNSKAITPSITVTLSGTEIVLEEGKDYEVAYTDNIDAGTATVTVTGTGNIAGTATAHFTITKKPISTDQGIASDMLLQPLEDQLYTGGGVTPDVDLKFWNQEQEIDNQLVLNKDYQLTYSSNVAVGTATVTITGVGNYQGSIESEFNILGPMKLADVAKIPAQQYTGNAVFPKPEITFAGKKLEENSDYTLDYKDNVERGTATITITGKGWYTGTKTVTFDIAREFSKDTVIKGVASAYAYTGKAIKPIIRVEDNGTVLTKGVHYKVSYKDNKNAGTATLTITGINQYSGTKKTTFKITPQRLGRVEVGKVADQTYTGKAKKPKVKLTSGSVTLKEGTDYKLVYVGNKKPGKADIVIKGKGNYTGTKTVSFNIIIPKLKAVKVKKYTDNSITFSWKKNDLVNGYEIYNSKNRRVAHVRKNSTTSATVSKLKANKIATFRVRSYVISGGKRYFSSFVKIKASTGPKATTITSIASPKSKQATIKWKKVKGATTYQVYRSTSKKGKYKKLTATKKTSYTDKKATGGKTYYYKIRVGKKSSLGTFYSSYSPVRSIKAKN